MSWLTEQVMTVAPTVLHVCLCDGPVQSGGQFPSCVCHAHRTVPLKALMEADVRCLLYIMADNGDIVPLRPSQIP